MNIDLPDVVHVPRTDPVYNAHGYLTKVPIGAIRPFIRQFSEPGDLILDPFAGSGMTGVAAVIEGRVAALSDLAVLGQHIGQGFLSWVPMDAVDTAASEILEASRQEVGGLYRTERAEDGTDVEWVRTIWSFVYECPKCSTQFNFFHAATGAIPPLKWSCEKCGEPFKKRNWANVDDIPVSVVVNGTDGKQVEQPVNGADQERINSSAEDKRLSEVPSNEITPDREMYRRSALGRWGLTETSAFFTPRNALVLLDLWKRINEVEDPGVRQKLRFAFTAILPRASRRYQWSAKRPLNAQNQTYYISPVHFEWNVFDLFTRKVRAVMRAQAFIEEQRDPLFKGPSSFTYRLASANNIAHLDDCSVSYVFTDPPFGSNIFYSDMNLFQEAWLGSTTDNSHEAVIHTGGKQKAKAAEKYEEIIAGACKEAFRVLKPGGYMSLVFGNSRGSVWSMVQRGLQASGFQKSPVHLALLDKGQRSVKGLASGREGVVTVDLVLTVRKPDVVANGKEVMSASPAPTITLIRDALKKLPPEKARNPSYVYVGAVKEAVIRNMPVDDLHLSDVLVALTQAGYSVDPKTGLLNVPADADALSST